MVCGGDTCHVAVILKYLHAKLTRSKLASNSPLRALIRVARSSHACNRHRSSLLPPDYRRHTQEICNTRVKTFPFHSRQPSGAALHGATSLRPLCTLVPLEPQTISPQVIQNSTSCIEQQSWSYIPHTPPFERHGGRRKASAPVARSAGCAGPVRSTQLQTFPLKAMECSTASFCAPEGLERGRTRPSRTSNVQLWVLGRGATLSFSSGLSLSLSLSLYG